MAKDDYVLSTSASAMPAIATANDLATLISKIELHPVTIKLPSSYLEGIGKIVTQWALQEWMLAGIICLLLDIDRKEARIAVGSPRAVDTLRRIKQLCAVKQIIVPSVLPTPAPLERGEKTRDLVGHGIWLYDDETKRISIQNTSGEWNFGPKQEPVSKRLYPEAKPIDGSWFEEELSNIQSTIEATDKAYQELEFWFATPRNTSG
jgi:hypothetical protein